MTLDRLSATFLTGLVMATSSVATGCSSSTDTPISGETSGASPAVSTQLEGASSAPPGEATTAASTSSASFPMEAAVGIAESKEQFASMSLAEATQLMGLLGHPDSVQELVAGLAVDLERRDEVAPAGLKLRVAVIETRLVASSDTEASVALWTAEFVTGAGGTRVTYNTILYELAFHDGQWLLVAEDSIPGPVPTPIQEPFEPSAFEAALIGFSDEFSGEN